MVEKANDCDMRKSFGDWLGSLHGAGGVAAAEPIRSTPVELSPSEVGVLRNLLPLSQQLRPDRIGRQDYQISGHAQKRNSGSEKYRGSYRAVRESTTSLKGGRWEAGAACSSGVASTAGRSRRASLANLALAAFSRTAASWASVRGRSLANDAVAALCRRIAAHRFRMPFAIARRPSTER
jgi:hypothetical protein